MRFSADTDWLESPPPESPQKNRPQRQAIDTLPKRQPHYLVADVLLEVMGWLATIDWLICSDPLRYIRQKNDSAYASYGKTLPGYSLIRATHVCRYWRFVALENRSLWRYIPLSETLSRDYSFVDREFACRVQRSIGLARGLHVSYAECPIHEQVKYRNAHLVASNAVTSIFWIPNLPSDHVSAPDVPFVLPPEYSISQADLCPDGHSYVFYRLYPLLLDSIKRATVLTLKGRGETLTDLFGHLLDRQRYGPSFSGTVMLSHFVHPTMPPSLDPHSISHLPLLTELTLELMDSTNHYVFPSLPLLRKLTLIRHVAQPHLALPIVPKIFDSYSLWDSAVNLPSPVFPALEDITITARNVNLYSLHHFMIAHALTLTSVTLQTTTDILNPYVVPPILHPANFTIPARATERLVPVPSYADTRSSASTSYVIHLPKLKRLSIHRLTTLLLPHIEVWACPQLEELEVVIPSRLPPPPTILTTSFVSLRKLVYGFPDPQHGQPSPGPEPLSSPDSFEMAEQNSTSKLLISLIKALPTLEELVVDGWKFRHVWDEVDWLECLMPPGTVALQDFGIEYDLDCIEDDPWNPNHKRKEEHPGEGHRSRWQTKDGRPFSIKKATITTDGMLLDDNGERLELVESDEDDFEINHDDEDQARTEADTKEGSALHLHLKIPAAKPKPIEELLCPRLSLLELRRCSGMERSLMFACLKERIKVADGTAKQNLHDQPEEEGSWSPLSSPGSSRAPSSGLTDTPVTDRLSGISSSPETRVEGDNFGRSKPASQPTNTCAFLTVDFKDCDRTPSELENFYAQYLRGDYVLRKPRRPRRSSP
ncbi:hypothetical protein M408DRAFT_330056 [Serendipita vermifera MAFF 305830]|uniref:Uncharacterized protein n=1 Tax=Serendipita vermifera MAFF 305830 TaxID=933852 RepID=A0A0C3ARX9_SERVB|nr:hypothetical protein M408DRAFT_330056 [Serendipita vermifera MAFF 305830]